MPFLDIAYQGFGDGIDADGAIVRRFAATPGPLFVASSFSKSFSLYGERVGALSIVAADRDEAARVLSQLKRVIRANYSNPPTHGGQIVATVLDTPELRALWEQELGEMRDRIDANAHALVERLARARAGCELRLHAAPARHVLLLRPDQRRRSRDCAANSAIYAIDTGRICVAALNSRNIDYVADAIAKVIK